ncbi:hypothetical protein HN748_02420 [Candidatus Peregrinibacteria bacterium]|jgi:hypothetical protein|nr:hypothetical protein [Candidatus Peregrinibacteria bacterium]MBT7703063.1 hypothetical protein [Candidatus Peregrinibacteria bacterium]
MSVALSFDGEIDYADLATLNPWGAQTNVPRTEKADFERTHEEPRVYLQKEHVRTGQEELDNFMNRFRLLLNGLGFKKSTHDSEADVFESEQGSLQVLLHRWRGALKEGEGLEVGPKHVSARKMPEGDIDTEGWAIAMRGTGPELAGITALVLKNFPSMTPIRTNEGSVVYAFGHPVEQEARQVLPELGMRYEEKEGLGMGM